MAGALGRSGLTGAAGEYHVAAQLSQRGWLATITIKNSPGTDVLAQHADTGTLIAVQSKTTTAGDTWVLGVKDETPTTRTDSWYVLVALRGLDSRPDFFIVPRNHIVAYLWVGHRNWLRKPGRGGTPRKDNPMRNVSQSEIGAYKERWDLLLGSTAEVPYALPDWFARHVGWTGLPPGHPDAALFPATPPPAAVEPDPATQPR